MAGAQLMADCEYGRVFTEADVKLLMAFAYLEGRDGKSYGQDAEGNAIDRGAHLLAEWQRAAGGGLGERGAGWCDCGAVRVWQAGW
jgi:hypothetical protein